MKVRRDLWLACAEGIPSRLPLATMSQPPGPPHTPQSEAASTIVPRPASSLATAEHVGGVELNVVYKRKF